MVILGQAVIHRIGVRDLPYTDVPLICAALYVLKEFWRERLMTEAIDGAIRCIKKEVERPDRATGDTSRSTIAA